MKNISAFIFLLLIIGSEVSSQQREPTLPFIRGLRVYAGNNETTVPVIIRGDRDENGQPILSNDFITIVFDVNESSPPRLQIKFRHCSKNWEVDDIPIVKDDFYSTSRFLFYEPSPVGVKHYTFHFKNAFPSADNPFVRFLYSGNWTFDVLKEFDERTVYASGRFYVVDAIADIRLKVQNDFWTDFSPPLDRVHKFTADIKIPDSLFTDYVNTVDFIQNFRTYDPARVSVWERKINTHVEGVGLPEKKFTFYNVNPGNAYRWYDLRNVNFYPNNKEVIKAGGPDFTRYRFTIDQPHHYGSAVLNHTGSWDDDYLKVLFELSYPKNDSISIFLVGLFNNWDPMKEDQLVWDEKRNEYLVWKWLRRGSYDYQYIIGRYDSEKGFVVDQDWTTIEGSGWETRNRYWCLVYYDDNSFGGIDRIVGFAEVYSGL